jgi:hypothetical protein
MLRYDLFISDVYRRRREEGGNNNKMNRYTYISLPNNRRRKTQIFNQKKKPREAFPRDTRKASGIDLTQNLNSLFFFRRIVCVFFFFF